MLLTERMSLKSLDREMGGETMNKLGGYGKESPRRERGPCQTGHRGTNSSGAGTAKHSRLGQLERKVESPGGRWSWRELLWEARPTAEFGTWEDWKQDVR